jgi:hypothetical protein
LAIVLFVLLRYTDSDYLFGIFWPLCCLFFFGIQILITSLISFGHCVVCSSSVYRFWLLLWYLQTFLTTLSDPRSEPRFPIVFVFVFIFQELIIVRICCDTAVGNYCLSIIFSSILQ